MNSVSATPARRLVVAIVAALIASLALVVAVTQPAAAQEYTVDEGTLENSSGGTVAAGETIVISGGGFEPGSAVRVALGSVLLAVVTADAEGGITARVRVPADLTAGVHTLTATGAAPGGGVAVLSQAVTVAATTDGTSSGNTSSGGAAPNGLTGAVGSESAQLPATGVPATVLLVAAVLFLAAGSVLVARRSRV